MKNTTIIWGLLGLAIIVGLIYYVGGSPTVVAPVTSTTTPPVTIQPSTPTPPVPQIPEAGNPIAMTSADVTTSESAASVSGTVTPRGFFTNYWYEYGLTENLGNKTSMQNIGSGYATLTAPGYITGLLKNTTYHFRLVAENQYGKVAGNQFIFKTDAGNPAPIGSIPTVKTTPTSGISRIGGILHGEVTPNKSTTQYWFEYGKTSNFGNTSAYQTMSDTSSKMEVSLALSNLDPATNYYFRLNAQNQWGTVNGVTLTWKTSGPVDMSKPTIDTTSVSNLKDTTVTLRGTINPHGIESTYWFEYSTDSLLGLALLKTTDHTSAGASSSTVSVVSNISGLQSGVIYFYRIVAQNSAGALYGDRVSFKTK
jgi:hypothetical protein